MLKFTRNRWLFFKSVPLLRSMWRKNDLHVQRPSANGLAVCWLPSQLAHADPVSGERLARQWCANCHVIDGSGPSATLPQGPPSFRVAAGHLTPGELRAFLTHPHGQMPDFALTRPEIDDLMAYIESLQ